MSHRREKRARRLARPTNAAVIAMLSLEALCAAEPKLARAQSAQSSSSTQSPVAATAATPNAPKPATADAGPGTSADESGGAQQEVVITGYRESLESAINSKRQADLPIESIAPEDIGKMPDQNVAEALQRLPGVQIDRAGGFGTSVLIEGLRQNLTTLNGDLFLTGREFYVSGEAANGGGGANSQYGSLEGIPSEEIGGIDVYKNPNASLTEGGIGGTVDLKTRDPLEQPLGLTGGGNFRESASTGTSGIKPDGTLVASYRFNDRFGITGSFSYDDEQTFTKQFQDQNRAQWLTTNQAMGPYTGSAQASDITTLPASAGHGGYYTEPQLAYFTNNNDDRKLYGGSFGVAGHVTDAIKTRLDWFYSKENDTDINYSDKAWFNGQGDTAFDNSGAVVPHLGLDPTQPYGIDGNGVLEYATMNANGAETATMYQHTTAMANNLQWKTEFDAGGPVRGKLDISWSQAQSDLEADQADIEHGLYNSFLGVATSPAAPGCNNGASTCATGNHGYEFGYTNGGTSGLPTVSYPSDVLYNPAYATFKSNWAWSNKTTNTQWAVKGDVQYDESTSPNGVQAVLSAGVRVQSRSVDEDFGRYLINGATLGVNGIPAGSAQGNCCVATGSGTWLYYQDPGYATIPYSTAVSNPNLAMTVNSFAAGAMLVKNPYTSGMTNPATYLQSVWAAAGIPNATERRFKDNLSSFDVHEYTTSEYFMEDIGGKDDPYHINFGVRVVSTNLTIDGGQAAQNPTYYGTASWNGVDSNVVPVETTRSYTDILPSFNVEANVADAQKVRFSAARVEAPMDLFSLGEGNSYNFTRSGSSANFIFAGGTSGNPNLEPYRATQGLIAYENYFARSGLLQADAFWKQIDSFVITQNVPTTIGGNTANVSEPVNAGSGRVYGFELGGEYALDSTMFRGLGIAANYTLSQSTSSQVTAFSSHASIPGVAHDSFTVQSYYERFGFSGRLSYSYQGKRVNDSLVGSTFQIYDQSGNPEVLQVFAAPYGQLDAQISYDITSHIGVVLSAQNLTDEAAHTYLQWPNQPFTYDNWGRRYFFGVKGKF